MPDWTEAQKKVIDSDAGEIICSAAAGSGKTAVMIERIIRLLREGAEPESFLIMTFTNAAASEMREKIRNRLYQERNSVFLRNALDRLDMIQISTIHAFCQQLIRNQFHLVGMDPNFQICDTSQRTKLFHEAFTDACNSLLEEKNPLYDLLRSRFDLKSAEKMITDLEPFVLSLPDPEKWMDWAVHQIPEHVDPDHPWFATVRQMAGESLFQAEMLLNQMDEMFSDSFALADYRSAWEADAELFHVKQLENDYPDMEKKTCVFARLKPVRGLTVQESDWKDRYQNLRKAWKEELSRVDTLYGTDDEQTLAEWLNMRQSLEAVTLLLKRTEGAFQLKKKARALADFQDLEQYAVQILSTPQGQEEAHHTWRYVFVDECQDNSAVQNRIIDLLQHPENHLFMVGDVKQSIYRFRLADPVIFMDRIRRCRDGRENGQECIFLQSNFRSRPEILETTNRVFRTLMKETVTEIEYGPEEELIPGRETEGTWPVQIIRIEKEGNEDLSDLEKTAEFLTDEIKTLLQTRYEEKDRNYQYRDMVILMPAVKTHGPRLAEMLEQRKIPVFFDAAGDYYSLREVQQVRNLLAWIDYPLQDLPLISVLRETPFFFTEEELSAIRLKKPEKEAAFYEAFEFCAEERSDLGDRCRKVKEKLRLWQSWAETMRVPDLIWELYRDTDLYYLIAAEPSGEIRQANLRMLAQQASQGESRGVLTLRQFLAYMKDQQSFGDQQSATLLGDQDDLVRIMTIHKSKGLQFPVVFCAGMDQNPLGNGSSGIRAHARLGLCVDYKDPDHRISRPTLASEIFDFRRKREEMAEKIRLLYVAMTRAQERLYLMTCQEVNPVWSMPAGEARILSARTYTDWWMPVFLQGENENLSTGCSHPSTPYEIRVFECNQQKTVENRENIHSLENWLKTLLSVPPVDELWKKPQDNTEPVMVKKSVTSLVRSAQDALETEEETAETKREENILKRRLRNSEMSEAPAFLRNQGKISAAWRGTLTHRVLSLMDLDALRRGDSPEQVYAELKDRMIRDHMASREEMSWIREEQITDFWRSETGCRILNSSEVHREWNFNLLVQRDQERMMLQGVIDCAFREGEDWVILDYKTDRGKTAEELRTEYEPQLLWYARAVEDLTGKKVREAALYSLALDEYIPIQK